MTNGITNDEANSIGNFIDAMSNINEEQIRDEARKAANRSQFMSNHIYDHKSYEDGFYEGMKQALHRFLTR